MMLKKLYIYILALTMMASCLDKYPDDAIPADKAIQTVGDADQLVVGIYAGFKSSALYSGLLTLLPDIQCDMVYAVNGYSNTYGDIWRGELLATNGEITAVYGTLYSLISQCNFAIDEMDKLRPTLDDDEQIDKIDQLYGEAYMARALCYSELIRLFCEAYDSEEQARHELGVVLRSHYHQAEPIRRSTLQEAYEFVLADLDRAAERLQLGDDFDGYVFNTTFFNEYTAYALRARVALYMRDWQEAERYASKVIGSGQYLLAAANESNYSAGESDYEYMWTSDNSTEIIWKVGFTTESYGGALGQVFFNYNYLSYLPDYVPAQWVLNLYEGNDMRAQAFFSEQPTGYSHGLMWPLLIKYFGNQQFLAYNILHVSMPKVFRLSEQYLIRAEAYAQMGNYSKASRDIATLRAARYASYAGTPSMTNIDDAMNVIEQERVKELYMEGFRLMDLKRWHKGFMRTPQAETLDNGNHITVDADDARFTWPIPQHELESPGCDIEPNRSNQ